VVGSGIIAVMKHYSRRWDESRGDAHDEWGASTWYFEVEPDGHACRQIEVYDNGPVKRYGLGDDEDDHGGLTYAPFDFTEWEPFHISGAEFERLWGAARSINPPSPDL